MIVSLQHIVEFTACLSDIVADQGHAPDGNQIGRRLEFAVMGRTFIIHSEWVPTQRSDALRDIAVTVVADVWTADFEIDTLSEVKHGGHFEGDAAQFERDLVLMKLAAPYAKDD